MNNKLSEITDFILTQDNFLILTHARPDGDAIASASAIQLALMSAGKNSEIFLGDPIQDKHIKYLGNNIYFSKPEGSKLKYECIICLDCGNIERLSCFGKVLELDLPIVNIDHHPDNTYFGTVNYVNSQACATSEIIFDILRSSPKKWTITKLTADSILMGMLMDTGGLRFNNTTVTTLQKTGELITLGADYIHLIRDLYLTKPLKLMQLESDIILNHTKICHTGKMAYCVVDDNLLKRYDVELKDVDALIDIIRFIKGTIISAVISGSGPKFKISLRSNSPDYPVNQITHKYSGGGHLLAAGCHIKADKAKDVEKILIKETEELLSN